MKMKNKVILKQILYVCLGSTIAVILFATVKFILLDIRLHPNGGQIPRKRSNNTTAAMTVSGNVNLRGDRVESDKISKQSYVFDKDCDEKFNSTLEDNLDLIRSYPGGTADSYMWKIGGNFTKPLHMRRNPVLVTAASKDYFQLLMKMTKSFHHKVVNYRQKDERITIVIYDIGLTRKQVKTLKTSGLPCTVREFPFDEFPSHVRILKYHAWKPIIIQMLLIEFGFVWWIDTPIRFKTLNVDKAFGVAKKYGLVYRIQADDEIHRIARQTSIDTFKYLGEDICKFKEIPESDSSSVMVYYNDVSSTVVRAWAKCALDRRCISPDNALPATVLECVKHVTYTDRCHNFDQSVFSILTSRIYHHQKSYSFNKVSDEMVLFNRSDILDPKKCKNRVCFI